MDKQSKVCLVHGSRTPTALQLTYDLAKGGWPIFASWAGPLRSGPSKTGAEKAKPTYTQSSRATMEKALFKLKHDQEDLGDEHVLRTVISSVEENGDNARVQSVIFHVCAEKDPDGESDSDILEAMEEGVMETRKSLRFVTLVHPLLQLTDNGALIFLLPQSEAADSSCMRSAAHKTSRIVGQNPLRHADGVPCTFALQPQQCAEINAQLILRWLEELFKMPKQQWSAAAGRVVPLCAAGCITSGTKT